VFDVAAVDRLRRANRAPSPAESLAREMLFYFEAWGHLLRGDLREWLGEASRARSRHADVHEGDPAAALPAT
jgi:hypothetical protein